VTELENLLAAEQNRNQQLQQEKQNEAKTSQTTLETLRLDVERLASAKEDLSIQLCNKDVELTDAKNEASRLSRVLERYRTEHIRSTEVLRSKVLEVLAQCNLDAPPTSFPSAPSGPFMSG
jgi:hypothetical protein